MTTGTAPYRFVHFSHQAKFVENEETISHDVPFEDGLTGFIELELKNVSPLHIGSHSAQDESNSAENKQKREIQRLLGEKGLPIIPGSTLKGLIRSNLKILYSGKIQNVDDQIKSYRDFSTQINNLKQIKIRCGFIKKRNNAWILEDWGEPVQISYTEIDKKFNTQFNTIYRDKKIEKKEQTFLNKINQIGFDKIREDHKAIFDKKGHGLKKYKFDKDGSPCKLVVTGQPDTIKGKGGKKHDFLFIDPEGKSTGASGDSKKAEYYVDDHLISSLSNQEINLKYDGRIIQQNNNLKSSKNDQNSSKPNRFDLLFKIYVNEIPVFFTLKKDPNTNKYNRIDQIGFSYIMRTPNSSSAAGLLDESHFLDGLDFIDTIIGQQISAKEMESTLKSRVSFGIFKATNEGTTKVEEVILANPKNSYHPFYVKNGREYKAGPNKSELAGLKRYPSYISNKIRATNIDSNSENDNQDVKSKLVVLEEGLTFKGRIRFFNLRPEELGALLTAITLKNVNNKSDLTLQIGSGKPFGWGKMKMESIMVKTNGKIPDLSISDFIIIADKELKPFFNSLGAEQLNAISSTLMPKDDDELNYEYLTPTASSHDKRLPEIKRKSMAPLSSSEYLISKIAEEENSRKKREEEEIKAQLKEREKKEKEEKEAKRKEEDAQLKYKNQEQKAKKRTAEISKLVDSLQSVRDMEDLKKRIKLATLNKDDLNAPMDLDSSQYRALTEKIKEFMKNPKTSKRWEKNGADFKKVTEGWEIKPEDIQ
jgi:CRISPR-associated protein (TIGR03986 family)